MALSVPAKAVPAAIARPAASNPSLGQEGAEIGCLCRRIVQECELDQAMSAPDNELSKLLQNWNPNTELGGSFNRQVWLRIESSEGNSWERVDFLAPLCSWLQALARPRLAFSAATIAMLIGILVGGLQARSMQEEQYLLSVNPYRVNRTQITPP
jgi:hypothetical protein